MIQHDLSAMDQKPLFVPAPFFLVRSPLFPVEEFFKLLNTDNISEYIINHFFSNPELREAIAIASPSLYSSILDLNKEEKIDQKKKKQVVGSLFKYVLRMSTRSTPFGLFSFVSMGSWSIDTCMEFNLDILKKRLRPDMEWLFEIINQACLDSIYISKLYLKRNPIFYESMGRIHFPFIIGDNTKNSVSIHSSSLVKLIIEKSERFINHNDLINEIILSFPSLEPDKISLVLQSLLKERVLISHIFPSLLEESPFNSFLEKISSLFPSCSFLPHLNQISYLVNQYNNTAIGEGNHILKQIEEEMKSKASNTYLFQVDTASYQVTTLTNEVALELCDAAEILWKLSPATRGDSYLRSYHTRFLEKYGLSRAVPLLELLDENKGLGIPDYYLQVNSDEARKKPSNQKLEQWLMQEWTRAFTENKNEIAITNEIAQQLSENKENSDAPISFDLFCEIFADSPESIDKGDFSICAYLPTDMVSGCTTMGRFLDLLGEGAKGNIRTFFQDEEALEENRIFAEADCFPSTLRAANVSIRTNLRKWIVDSNNIQEFENEISLEKIYVGATDKHLFLTFENGQKELSVDVLNVVNPSFMPIPIRLLRDISRNKYQFICPIYWDKGELLPFLPRIRYKRTILSLAQWKLSLSIIKASEDESIEILAYKIKRWAEEWKLPHLLWMTLGDDNRLLLDWTNSFHLEQIAHQLKNNPKARVILVECLSSKAWVKSNKGTHFSEFVVPILKNKHYSSPSLPSANYVPISYDSRWKIPGSEWFYAKIYLRHSEEDIFLSKCLDPFVQEINELIDKWFFTRYKDESGWHIRFRCKAKQEKELNKIFNHFYEWSNILKQEGWIKEIIITSYEREIERYGGEQIIDIAESFFQADSQISLLLMGMLSNRIDIPSYVLTSISIVDILLGFNFSLDDQIDFFSHMRLEKKALFGHREWRQKMIPMLSALFRDNGYQLDEKFITMFKIFEKRKKIQSCYLDKIQKLPSYNPIIRSLLHMHCNRMLGVDSSLEERTYLLAWQGIISLSKKQRI